MSDINDVLMRQSVPVWSSQGVVNDEFSNTNAQSAATAVTLPAGCRYLSISSRGGQDFKVWVLAAGASAPVKSNGDGGQSVNGSAEGRWQGMLDPDDPPTVWVGEDGGSNDDFDVVYNIG
tara:strand:+ start:513 stop:872 length:360 start_codon:yes stop_codon:yes gene_type:complete